MPLLFSQFVWGFEVFDSGSNKNNRLAFSRQLDPGSTTTYDGDGANPAASLKAGVYTADELAAEVQRAMRERTSTTDLECTFNYATLKFEIKITGTGNLSLLFGTGAVAATDCNVLLGYNASDRTTDNLDNGDTYVSDTAVAAAPAATPGTPAVWATAEPLLYTSPATVAAIGTAASGTQRVVATMQRVSDGGTVESIHFSTLRTVQIAFRALTTGEQTKMESFLDWISKGKRITWQPDKTSANGMKLVLANPGAIAGAYEWLTRPEVGYGTLTFFEQLS